MTPLFRRPDPIESADGSNGGCPQIVEKKENCNQSGNLRGGHRPGVSLCWIIADLAAQTAVSVLASATPGSSIVVVRL